MQPRQERQRGAVLIWAVVGLVTVGALTALAINVGRALSVRGGLQNGADAAALAAAAELNGQLTGLAAAPQAAVALAGQHQTDMGLAVTLDPAADVVLGAWDRTTSLFTPVYGRTLTDLRNINAVQVRDGREAARGNAVPVVFGGAFLSARTLDVRTSAVAVGGGPCEDKCAFPAAFADCLLVNPDGSLNCDDRFYVFNSDWQDNIGFTSLEPGVSASVPNIKAALGACVASSADEPIPITNGNPVQPISQDPFFKRLPMTVNAPVVHADRCPPAQYQKCSQASPNGPCLNAKFVGDMTVVGYVTLKVCYITGSTVKVWPPADWPAGDADCGAAPGIEAFPGVDPSQWPDPFLKQTLFLKHKCHYEQPGNQSGVGGCGYYGTYTTRSRLVQ
ncbi:MAG TPA: pilus assembly protein TadG-related protein [Anaeromyxobacteraceae bacterium]|nr:pilus assembly protein TadG-related protein [Anaeromyxobacteraceae bacterium]